jgi:hypothetical protein
MESLIRWCRTRDDRPTVADKVFSDYEWTQADPKLRETKGYREAMIPATELNRSRVAIVND